MSNGFYPGEQTLELTCSGCEQIWVTLNGAEPEPGVGETFLYDGPIALTTALENASGQIVAKWTSVDEFGNKEETKTGLLNWMLPTRLLQLLLRWMGISSVQLYRLRQYQGPHQIVVPV